MLWGVYAFYYDKYSSTDTTVTDINEMAKQKGFLASGDMAITLTSVPIEKKGMVNSLRITQIA